MRRADGSSISRAQLDEIIAQVRTEAWDLVDPPRPAEPLPPGVNEYEAAVDEMLQDAHLAGAFELPDLVSRHAEVLGASDAVLYLADLQQTALVPLLPPEGAVPDPSAGTAPRPLPVDTTMAGRAFQHLRVLIQPARGSAAGLRVWLPLLNGTDRLGVLGVSVPRTTSDDELRTGALGRRLRRLAALSAELLVTKTFYGDTIVRARRQTTMGLAAELQWSQLPPLTFSSSQVTVAAALEPAYSVAGDSVDYAVDAGRARFAVFDGMGHGLQSAHLSVLAVAAYRNARRAGRTLTETAVAIDDAVHGFAPGEAYCSGLLAELDTETGQLSWINAGHPEPLVLRRGRLARTLHADRAVPFGIGPTMPDAQAYAVGTEKLQPHDRLVLYTDGVTDARSPDGSDFGLDRLVDLLVRADDPDLPLPEIMRRVVRALLDHQQDQLADDATLLAVDWRSDDEDDLLPR